MQQTTDDHSDGPQEVEVGRETQLIAESSRQQATANSVLARSNKEANATNLW